MLMWTGAHIRTLLPHIPVPVPERPFLPRAMVYVGMPPLYKVGSGQNHQSTATDEKELRNCSEGAWREARTSSASRCASKVIQEDLRGVLFKLITKILWLGVG